MSRAIAIVGMACRYPDARSPEELWENVLAQRQAFRRIPRERMRIDDYCSDDAAASDRTYSTMAAVITGWELDRSKFRVSRSTYEAADIAHWLALDVAAASFLPPPPAPDRTAISQNCASCARRNRGQHRRGVRA